MIRFEWDNKKAKINLVKHKISFKEGKTVFYDENARLIVGHKHSNNEDLFVLL